MTAVLNATGATRLIWLLPVLPLAGFAVNVLFGQRLRALAGWIATMAVAAAFAIAVAALFELLSLPSEERTQILRGYEWFASGDLRVAFDLRWDPLSATMALVVTGVSSLIHLYSIGYMEHDERRETFFSWLNLFVASMLVLVLAQNFVVMFLGWEGVGLCSYLLVGFWFNRRLLVVNPLGRLVDGEPDDTYEVWAPPAAKKAFLANRIGDVGFLLAMFLIFATTGSLDFDVVFGEAGALAAGTATAIALLLFLACTGKSAQFPLYVWLPDAMAGPTPVSALIHAATMVTAGVFLVARTHTLFEASGTAQTVVVLVGAGTALLAAVIAIGQDDIKKILAFSTVSQLGYMFIGVGLGPIGYVAGMFHLVTHATFKAQLFLGAGSVMHGNDDDTDIKHFGGLRSAMPITFWTTMAAWAAIVGVPFTSGFYSKDQVLAALFEQGGVGLLAWVIGVFTAGLTAFYMSRYVFLTFFGERRWPEGRHPHESPPVMTVPLIVLAALALVAGFALTTFTGEGGRFQTFLEPVLGAPEEHESLAAAAGLSAVATGLAAAGAIVAWLLYIRPFDWLALRRRWVGVWQPLADKLYVDQVYEFFTVNMGGAFAAFLARNVDQRGIDGAVNGVAELVGDAARSGRRLQSGLVRSYALAVLGGAVLIVAFLVFRP
ncbi:MAG TPA: NADH-quinone oxidoreductase subunit L [Actinomycetes bacterium]|nr:NADH-quinone oxidoreductase subunit L [Actinomycetes bacterium]